MKSLLVFVLIMSLLLSSCAASAPQRSETEDPAAGAEPLGPVPGDGLGQLREEADDPAGEPAETGTDAKKRLAEMSLREKVGQLFLIRPDSLEPSLTPEQISDPTRFGVTEASEAMRSMLARYPAGGFVFFGKNLTDPSALRDYMLSLSSVSPLPPLFAVDEEGGLVSRVANCDRFGVDNIGFMAEIGASGDPGRAYDAGKYIGGYLASFGFHLNFAPVADLNTNPYNIVIGDRAFGSDPDIVSSLVAAFLKGQREQGVVGCLKHFPGHGDTSADTHEDYVSVWKSWEELQRAELIPFTENFSGADLVMVAHITLPHVTDDGLPASLSRELITDRLKHELGYTGLVTTDALDMGAIRKNYSSAEAAVLAIEAGVDILLMPYDYAEAFEGVLHAVQSGRISESRLDESVLKILELKQQYSLIP